MPTPTKHALLGASSAHRWLNCPPSARWEESFPAPESSEAAKEGTLAHAIAEERLRAVLAGKKPRTSAKHKKDPLYKPVMDEHADTYVTYIMELYNKRSNWLTKFSLGFYARLKDCQPSSCCSVRFEQVEPPDAGEFVSPNRLNRQREKMDFRLQILGIGGM